MLFTECQAAKKIVIGKDFTLSGAENTGSLFWKCTALETIEGSEYLNLGSSSK